MLVVLTAPPAPLAVEPPTLVLGSPVLWVPVVVTVLLSIELALDGIPPLETALVEVVPITPTLLPVVTALAVEAAPPEATVPVELAPAELVLLDPTFESPCEQDDKQPKTRMLDTTMPRSDVNAWRPS